MNLLDEWDVVVVGGGGAGLAAAISASERGAKVLLFESQGDVGGSTALSGGMFTAGGTKIQRALGVEDSVDRYFQHYMDLNQWKLKPGLIHAFCERSVATLDWLLELGVEVPVSLSYDAHTPGLCRAGVEDVWRGHVPKDGGYGVVQVLDRARKRAHVELVLHTRVEQLLVRDGRVRGVVADGIDVEAGAVVVASGGLSHDPALLERYFPDVLQSGESLFVVAAPGGQGDHIRMAEQVDASIAGAGWGLLLITASFQRQHHWQAGFPPLSRLNVDANGRRFMDEDASYAVAAGIYGRHGWNAWTVFDERARLSLPDGFTAWTPENINRQADLGEVVRATNLSDLATGIGAVPAVLEHTVAVWNQTLPQDADDLFRRTISLRAKGVDKSPDALDTPPYYAVRTLPGELVCTHAGLEIDSQARVIDRVGRVIPGLFAAGEAGAGILGERYIGGGNSLANAFTMGRLAGIGASGKE